MVQAYVLFKVSSGTEREVCEKIANLDAVLAVSIIYGEYDLLAKISVPSMERLEKFLAEEISEVPSVILKSTMIVAKEYKGKTQRIKR